MSDLPKISEAMLRQHAGTESFARGEDYYRRGAVLEIARRELHVEAEVEGSQYDPYHVRLTLDRAGIVSANCTCPYDGDDWCKHIVATALTLVHQPDKVAIRPPLADILAPLDRDQLATLLLRLTERQPDLMSVLEAEAQTLRTTPSVEPLPVTPTPRLRHMPIDPLPIRRQARAILHSLDHMRRSEAYWHVGDVTGQLQQVIDQAQRFVEASDGENALIILDALTDEYMAEWEGLDDEGDETVTMFRSLGAVWTEALLTADLSPDERQTWAAKLSAWDEQLSQYGIDDVFGAAVAAAGQGWAALATPASASLDDDEDDREDEDDEDEDEDDARWYYDDLAQAGLNVLERQGRTEEFLALALSSQQYQRYATKLIELGQTGQAVEYAMRHLTQPEAILAVAQALREVDDVEASLRVAQHGLRQEGNKTALADWTADFAAGLGRQSDALAAALIGFLSSIDLPHYLKVQTLAGTHWPSIKADLLTRIKPHSPSYTIPIYLHEGMINEAVQAVDRGDYIGHELLMQVVERAIKSHPDWVIAQSRKQAETIMDGGKAQYYANAARWLEHALAAFRAAGRDAEWRVYLESQITRHQRKYKLRPMLEALRR